MNRIHLLQIATSFLATTMGLACGGEDALDIQILYSHKTSARDPTSLEIIDNDERLTSVVAKLGTMAFGGPSPEDGPPWHPVVDFEHDVVAFATVLFGSCPQDVGVGDAIESDERVDLNVIGRSPSCGRNALVCSFSALVQIPRLEKPYALKTRDSYPKCN
jgi:hypothetical protein